MGDFNGKTILIVEDDNDSRQMLRFFLEAEGYQIIEAGNGREALKLAVSAQPDLILMDLNMPELNGIDAARQIRQNADLSSIPIIANSGDGQRGMELFLNMDNLGKGFVSYLTKPLSLDALNEQVQIAMSYSNQPA